MSRPRRIVLTVTSDPEYDQRMIRICTSLQEAAYDVTIIGRKRPSSSGLTPRPYRQLLISQLKRDSGKLFYLTYNLKMLWRLLFIKADVICAIDLDTIVPVYMATLLRRKMRVYDAHELFSEMEEVVRKPAMRKIWLGIERFCVPRFRVGYTVNKAIAEEFYKRYGVHYEVVRSATVLRPLTIPAKPEKIILYQGAVNHGRCFEQLIPAMKAVDARLVVCGMGNFLEEAKALAEKEGVTARISFEGYVAPEALREYTLRATVGITLFVATSLSNKLSLANRFFDYMHAGVPQLGVAYPEYEKINNEFELAALLDEVTPQTISSALNRLLNDEAYYCRLQEGCLAAREVYNWQREEETLLSVYAPLFVKSSTGK